MEVGRKREREREKVELSRVLFRDLREYARTFDFGPSRSMIFMALNISRLSGGVRERRT